MCLYPHRIAVAQLDTILTGNQSLNQSAGTGSKLERLRAMNPCGESVAHASALASQESRRLELCPNQAQCYGPATDYGLEFEDSAPGEAEGSSPGASPQGGSTNDLQSRITLEHGSKAIWVASHEERARNLDPTIPKLLHQMTNSGTSKPSTERQAALQQFLELSTLNENRIWSLYFHQIFTVIIESLDDSVPAIRELSLTVIFEMLRNQRERLVESTEALLEKLLRSMTDVEPKVYSAADRCLTVVLTEFDPYCCLMVVVPLLVSEDEKALVTCIASLTKLVSRLPPIELMAQLPTFLPALFEAFGHENAVVRKTVVFCLVDIYIVLGKAFVPYLGSLSSTQLRLVTIYANRISQARTGTPLESQL